MTPAKFKIHPFAELLPLMSADELGALKADIAVNGQREPIALWNGKILDGRNRQTACLDQDIKPRTIELSFKSDQDAIEYVYSKAVHRSLSDSQKAASAVMIEEQLARSAKGRQLSGKKSEVTGRARDLAAVRFGISGRYVQSAKALRLRSKRLFQQVFDGREVLTRALSRLRQAHKLKELRRHQKKGPKLPGEIIHGDCIEQLAKHPGAKLIIADPPYNIGVNYGEGDRADLLNEAQYFTWSRKWINACFLNLDSGGSFWLIINHENAANLETLAVGAGFQRRAWITWYETFGTNCSNNFNRCSRRLLYCVKPGPGLTTFTFNAAAFNRPSDRQSKYGDKRAVAHGKIWDDVWEIPRLAGTAKERIPSFPTQLPLALIRPIVLGCGNPGDLVIDPFSGSGTTVVACAETGRRGVGIEKNLRYVRLARQRLAHHVPPASEIP